ncbi:MAG TPA: glycosyltransferase family 2 protein [Myxococcota bacterium]|nr:glycosyltransferase family 2 protein [Myxococcota bacterium]
MIIQVLSTLLRRGYLPKTTSTPLAPYFAGMNLAVRRAALNEIGTFDLALRTGEDIDLCVRAHESRWELFFEPRAIVRHRNRETPRALWKQWFDYGWFHADLFRKHTRRSIEVLVLNHHPSSYTRYTPVFYKDHAPFTAQIFLTSFVLAHVAALLTLLLAPLGGGAPGLVVTGLLAAAYLREDLTGRSPLSLKLRFLPIRYLVNAAIVSGGLLGGARLGYLYVYGTLWRKAPAAR